MVPQRDIKRFEKPPVTVLPVKEAQKEINEFLAKDGEMSGSRVFSSFGR